MKNFTNRFAALGAAVMIAVSMSAVGASASNTQNWSLFYKNSNNKRISEAKAVTGLSTRNDNAIDFKCNSFTGGTGDTYALCNIQSSMKKISGEKVYLDRKGDSGSISFRSNWYGYSNGGKCSVYLRLQNYGKSTVSLSGSAS